MTTILTVTCRAIVTKDEYNFKAFYISASQNGALRSLASQSIKKLAKNVDSWIIPQS